MQLKQVEIFGFKTFADKVELSFSPGMTAIVGPNGCGKTNVLDAIRWVLGEQSSKTLRSNKMEDIIYNGGNTRKPLGMAEVSLTLANNKKILPIEYEDVTITRRLYRSGESEYFINKSECRLKDINELFMDTGMGSHVYSIIEQSQVDLILSNNPSLRRMLFEEAAGVMKYKTRKKETLSKLEHTEQNLLRINDIVEEVSRQAEMLKSQASKAQKYISYRDEFKELSKKLTLLEYLDIEQLLRTSSESLKNIDENKNLTQSEMNQKEADINALKVEIISIDRKIAEEHEMQFKLDMDLDKLESAITLNKERLQGLETQKSRDLENKNILEEKIEKNSQELVNIRSEIEKIKTEIEKKASGLTELDQNLIELKNQLKEKEKNLDELKNSELEIKKNIAAKESALLSQKAKAEELVNAKNKIEHEKILVQQNKKILEDKKSALEAEIQNIEKEKEKQFKALTDEYAALDKTKQDLKSKEDLIYQKFGEKKEKESRLATLKSLKDSLVGYFAGVKEILLEKKRGNFKGCIGTVADLIRTSQKYECAIEMALGANIQNIVAETAKDAKQAIEFLKNKEKGRATFLPLDLVISQDKENGIESVLKMEGVLGKAIDLIEFDKKYENVIKYLFNKVIIVRNLDCAINVLSSSSSRSFRLVTLDGETLNAAGAISGGSIDKRSTGLLGRERELDELIIAVPRIEQELNNEQALASSLKEKIVLIENSIQAFNKSYREKEIMLLEKNNLFARSKEDYEFTINRITELEKSIKQLDAENEISHEQTISSEKDVFELKSNLNDISKKIEELSIALNDDKKHMDVLQNNWTTAKMEHAAKQEKLTHIVDSEKNISRSIEELKISANQSDLNMKNFEENKTIWENEIKEKEKLIIELFEKKKDKSKEIFTVEEKHRELKEKIEKLEDEIKEKRKNFDKLQQEWYEIEVKNQEVQLKASTLLEKLQQEFSINEKDIDKIEIQEEIDRQLLKEKIEALRTRMIKMEPVNVMAIEEYQNIKERFDFLLVQKKDLEEARDTLLKTIEKINRTSESNFKETFELIKNNFIHVFKRFFPGGTADLILLEGPENIEPGIEMIAQPPGKKPQTITLLSGGERALTAIALIFGIFMVKPSPFCILDEVDAPLDDTNVEKYLKMIQEFSLNSQFITITHNKLTMERADTIYGVTMEEPGVSKLMSIRFKEAEALVR
ncbi:chromosome segregation protein SMC [Candidatus Poribacteria bacterium]|nr:chromosome segregation protein SMC [Candidatus Poribacteria bacterium]